MRTAKGKGNDARKVLTYYRVNFGILPPYKVLCDAPVMHVAPKRSIFLKEALPRLLAATAVPVVTRCIYEELRALGDEFAEAKAFAKRCPREPCVHGGARKSASDCISAYLEKGNHSKLLLATNDSEVMRIGMEKCDIPIVTIADQTRLVLRKPTAMAIESTKKLREEKNCALQGTDKALLADSDTRKPLRLKLGIVRKRRAKGPNPLSMKKSRKEKKIADAIESDIVENTEKQLVDGNGSEVAKGRGRRRRKRRGKQMDDTVVNAGNN